MKKALLFITLLILGGAGWYLLSPLFIDEVVDEAFPISNPQNESANFEIDGEEMNLSDLEKMDDDKQRELAQSILEEAINEPDRTVNEDMPAMSTSEEIENQPILISQGNFEDADSFHQGSGRAAFYQLPDDSHLIRFEDFEVTNGPDLRVILTKSPTPSLDDVKNGVELAKLKGNKGNQNYELPEDIDPNDYKAIVIYCSPFSVIFSTASLN